jgi:SURF4 family
MAWKDSIDEPFDQFHCALGAHSVGDPVRAGRILQTHGRHPRDRHQYDEPRHTVSQYPGLGGDRGARWVALIIAAYTTALGLIFHAYWLAPAADMRFERIIFFNHISIIGGMLAIVAFGAGCLSLDAAMGRKSA